MLLGWVLSWMHKSTLAQAALSRGNRWWSVDPTRQAACCNLCFVQLETRARTSIVSIYVYVFSFVVLDLKCEDTLWKESALVLSFPFARTCKLDFHFSIK